MPKSGRRLEGDEALVLVVLTAADVACVGLGLRLRSRVGAIEDTKTPLGLGDNDPKDGGCGDVALCGC